MSLKQLNGKIAIVAGELYQTVLHIVQLHGWKLEHLGDMRVLPIQLYPGRRMDHRLHLKTTGEIRSILRLGKGMILAQET
ncbi:MAG: hypothetical protein JEZ06_17415 [Anaerolineaceae bacterium]|nr:hypothetical protein [Anaerolineaceae bacterium]